MNDHNLDDLIIDNIDPKGSKTKSFLTIVALAIVVLIVAIILTKIILKDPNEKLAIDEENHTEMISPELTLQNIIKKDIVEDKLSLETTQKPKYGPVADSEKKTDALTKIKPSTKEEEKKIVEVKPLTVEIKNNLLDNEAEKEAKRAEENRQKKLKLQKETAEKEAQIKKETFTKQIKNSYYIQVGSFTLTPSVQFLSVIKKSGFNYKITPVSEKGTKKLLIGPYNSRKEVDRALIRVRDRINKSAFVVKK